MAIDDMTTSTDAEEQNIDKPKFELLPSQEAAKPYVETVFQLYPHTEILQIPNISAPSFVSMRINLGEGVSNNILICPNEMSDQDDSKDIQEYHASLDHIVRSLSPTGSSIYEFHKAGLTLILPEGFGGLGINNAYDSKRPIINKTYVLSGVSANKTFLQYSLEWLNNVGFKNIEIFRFSDPTKPTQSDQSQYRPWRKKLNIQPKSYPSMDEKLKDIEAALIEKGKGNDKNLTNLEH